MKINRNFCMNRWECSYNGSGGWSTSENVGLNNANVGENTMPQRRIFIYLFCFIIMFCCCCCCCSKTHSSKGIITWKNNVTYVTNFTIFFTIVELISFYWFLKKTHHRHFFYLLFIVYHLARYASFCQRIIISLHSISNVNLILQIKQIYIYIYIFKSWSVVFIAADLLLPHLIAMSLAT